MLRAEISIAQNEILSQKPLMTFHFLASNFFPDKVTQTVQLFMVII